MEHSVFPNVGFLSVFEIIKGVFNKYFSNFCRVSLKDQEYNVNKTFLFFLHLSKKSKTFRIKVLVNHKFFFSLGLIIRGIKIVSDYDEIWLRDSFVFVILPQSFSWYLNWIRFRMDLVSRSLKILNFAWIYFRGLRYIICHFSSLFS